MLFLERVFAADPNVGTTVTDLTSNVSWAESLGQVFGLIINVVMGVAISLAVIFLGIGGIKYITSQGDPKASEAAKNAITNAVIGLVVAIAAFAIRTLVGNVIGGTSMSIEGVTPGAEVTP